MEIENQYEPNDWGGKQHKFVYTNWWRFWRILAVYPTFRDIFWAAQSSFRSLDVCLSVGLAFCYNMFVSKFPLLEKKSNIWYFTMIWKVVRVLTNCDKTQIIRNQTIFFFTKPKSSNCEFTKQQIVTKLKNTNILKLLKG